MSGSDAGAVPSQLFRVPPVMLKCEPVVVQAGDAVRCRLNVIGELPHDVPLSIELVQEDGDRVTRLDVAGAEEVSVGVPATLPRGSYEVRLTHGDWILDAIPIEV